MHVFRSENASMERGGVDVLQRAEAWVLFETHAEGVPVPGKNGPK